MRWTGKIFVPKDDVYEFFFDELDDAGRLILDGKTVINVWREKWLAPTGAAVRAAPGVESPCNINRRELGEQRGKRLQTLIVCLLVSFFLFLRVLCASAVFFPTM